MHVYEKDVLEKLYDRMKEDGDTWKQVKNCLENDGFNKDEKCVELDYISSVQWRETYYDYYRLNVLDLDALNSRFADVPNWSNWPSGEEIYLIASTKVGSNSSTDAVGVRITYFIKQFGESATPTSNQNQLKDTETEYSQYTGTWATAGRSWFDGGQILDIEVSGDSMTVEFSDIQAAPDCRVASVSQTVPVSDIKNGVIEIPFDNDGWGGSGTMTLTFTDDAIICETTDIERSDPYSEWGFSEMKYLLARDDYAHEAMEIGPDAYEGMLPEEKVENEDDIPYVNAEITILGQQFAPSDVCFELGYDKANVRVHPVNQMDDVQYYWLGQRQYEIYGVRDGIIVAYMDLIDSTYPEVVSTRLPPEFDGIAPKTITTEDKKYHAWNPIIYIININTLITLGTRFYD